MAEEEIRTKISDLKDDITRIEEDATKKEANAEKEIEADWDSKIHDTKSNLDTDETDLKEAIEKADEWVSKRNRLTVEVKSLKKEHINLLKGKDKALKDKLNNIEKEKKSKIKVKEKDIATLEKQLEKQENEKLKQKLA
ncbi:MAG: hypothetical protein ACFFC1_03110 [Promethearchaeota archaeon]